MKTLLLAASAFAMFTAPAHAQLLGGVGQSVTGTLGGSVNSTLRGSTETLRSSTRGTLRGEASTRGNQSVDRSSGSVAVDRSVDTSLDGFRTAMDVSVYTLVSLTRACEQLLKKAEGQAAVLTLSYYGSEKVVPNYNVMGVAKAALEASTRYLAYDLGPKKIRVNCISAGPMNTLAARGIAGFSSMLKHYEAHAPLKRNVMPEELGATGTFLASDGAAAITGQVLYVDCGYEIMGM